MVEEMKKVKAEFGREYPMSLNCKKVTTTEKRTSTNPSHPMEIIGVFQNATADMARKAVEDAHKYFDTWKKVSPQERAKFLFRAAQIVRERKFDLNALVCYEVGKTWTEADADIAETIDFLEYYRREMLRLGEPQKLVPMRGERNYPVYIPLGVGVIIPPWNFPSAIMAGRTASWWTKKRTLSRRWKARYKRPSAIRGRNVRRARARLSPRKFTTRLCRSWWSARRKSRWDRATIPTITWGQWSASRR